MCVCCREPWGEGGAGEGAVQGKGPGAGSDPSGPFGGSWKGEGRGQHEVSPFPPPHTHTLCQMLEHICWGGGGGGWGGSAHRVSGERTPTVAPQPMGVIEGGGGGKAMGLSVHGSVCPWVHPGSSQGRVGGGILFFLPPPFTPAMGGVLGKEILRWAQMINDGFLSFPL